MQFLQLIFKTQGVTYFYWVGLSFSYIFTSVLFLWLVFWRLFRWWGGGVGFAFFLPLTTIRMEEQDKLLFLPVIFLLEYPLHQHFPPAKLMLHQLFKHKEQPLCCHLGTESAQPAGEDAPCAPHPAHITPLGICAIYLFIYMGICRFFLLLNEGRFGLWGKCHLQHPLEQWRVWWICCKTHYIVEIFLSNTVVPENNLINHR